MEAIKKKSSDNFMKLEISARLENEAFIRSTVAAFCVAIDPTLEEISDIKTAVSEAVSNAIIHGYRDYPGNIFIEARTSGKELHISIRDEGVGIEDIDKARTPFYTTLADEERSGMGFTVMETFMNQVTVTSSGKGVTVNMVKVIK